MKPATIAGIALIVLGVISLSYQGIQYKVREKTVELGPIEVTTQKTKTIPLPPIVGGLALVGGIVLLAQSRRGS